jgi:hypothetical protein
VKIELYTEVCCDYCNEVEHTHMSCPACHNKDAGASLYGEHPIDQDEGFELTCEECKSVFKLIKKTNDMDTYEWEQVGAQVLPIRADK